MSKKYILIQDSCDCVQGFFKAILHHLESPLELIMVKTTEEARIIVTERGFPLLAIIDCCAPIDCENPTQFSDNDKGLATVKFIREHVNGESQPKIIMITTRPIQDLPHEAIAAIGGVNCIFPKPFPDSKIISEICTILGIAPIHRRLP